MRRGLAGALPSFAIAGVVAGLLMMHPAAASEPTNAATASASTALTSQRSAPAPQRSATARTRPPVRTLSPDAMQRDLDILLAALEEMHPGLTRYQSREALEAAMVRLAAFAQVPRDELAFYRAISLFLAGLRCDHTKAEYSPALENWRNEQASHLPFRFKLFAASSAGTGGARMLVSSSDAAQPLPMGAEILSINGRSVTELVRTLGEAVAIDGFTEPVRLSKLAYDSDLMGSNFEHYYPAFFGFPDAWQVRWRAQDGAPPQTSRLKPINFRQWQKLPSGTRYRDDFYAGISWRLAGKQALLKINTFVNYRNPVDARALLSGYFKMANERGVQHLVIDLRDSGGGSNDAVLALAAHLLPEPFTWTRRMSVTRLNAGPWVRHTERWDGSAGEYSLPEAQWQKQTDGLWDRLQDAETLPLNPAQPAPDRFSGRVTVLIGPANNSGATMLIAKLKDAGRVTLVGEATGGSAEGPTAGNLLFLRLPESRILVRVPLIFSRMNIASFEPGLGVRPDVAVVQTVEDFRAGRDTVMDTVRKMQAAPNS